MKHGSVPQSINLPSDESDGFSPDGLSETDIDAMLAETGLEVDPVELDECDDYEPAPIVEIRDDAGTPADKRTGGEAA